METHVFSETQMWTWCFGTWFSGGLDSVRLMVGLDDPMGLFQPKCVYDSQYFIESTYMISCHLEPKVSYEEKDHPHCVPH